MLKGTRGEEEPQAGRHFKGDMFHKEVSETLSIGVEKHPVYSSFSLEFWFISLKTDATFAWPTVCFSDVMNTADMCGESIKYATSQNLYVLHG